MNRALRHPLASVRRRLLRGGVAGLATLAALSVGRRADAAPGAALHVLCSGPAGSIPDLIARAIADPWATISGRRIVVDNRPGAMRPVS